MRQIYSQILLGLALALTATAAARAQSSPADLMSRQAIDWFKAINDEGPGSTLVPRVARSIENNLAKGSHIEILVPGDCAKSGKACYGLTWAGLFHWFEVSPEQARQLVIKAGSVTVRSSGRSRDSRHAAPLAQLDRLRVDLADRLTDKKPITGRVACQFYRKPAGNLVLRFSYITRDHTVAVTRPVRGLPADGVLSFRVDAINRDGKTRFHGPMAVFVDLCEESGSGFERKLTVVSNTMALLLDVQGDAAGPVGNRNSVVGTRWRFPGSKTTVEFLPGGRARYNDTDAGGKWKQEGSKLIFDCNDFTQWEMIVDGDTMKGKWRRLRGDDVGMEAPSSMRRILER